MMNLASAVTLLILGVVALAFTSVFTAGLMVLLIFEINALLASFGFQFTLFRPALFAVLFLFFLVLSVVHAYRTRWNSDSVVLFDMGSGFSTFLSLGWEFLSAGPILLILSIQDFWRYARLSRLDVPQVSTLLLWVFDRGGSAGFAEICLDFPGLNAVRVLPQLRDLQGINLWPDAGEISLSDDLCKTFARILGREPKSPPHFRGHSRARAHFQAPIPQVDKEIVAWYTALNLPLFAPIQQVKMRYRKLAKIYHPDAQSHSNAGRDKIDDEQMKRINEAYHNILKRSKTAG